MLDEFLQGKLPESKEDQLLKTLIQAKDKHHKRKLWQQELAKDYQIHRPEGRIINNRKRIYKAIGIAASILLLFSLLFFLYQETKQPDYLQLTDNYITTKRIHNISAIKKGPSELEALRLNAALAFNKTIYEEAIDHYHKILRGEDIKTEDYYYLGLSYLYQGTPELAITYFLQGKAHSQGDLFYQEINWFLALAYIKTNQIKEARSVLTSIKSNEWNYNKAQSLLLAMR